MQNEKDLKRKADSLMSESNKKKEFAYVQNKIGESVIKKGLGDVKTYASMPTGRERVELAKKARESASKDSAKSVELEKRLKLMKKK